MRRIAILLIVLLLGVSGSAQSLRTVKGITSDEKGVVIPCATLKPDGDSTVFRSDRLGRFEINIPLTTKYLTVSADGYLPAKVDVSEDFVIALLISVRSAASNEVVTDALPVFEPEVDAEPARRKSKLYKRGFYNAVDISYSYSFNRGMAVYTNLGERPYSAMHPLQVSYSLGYKFSPQYTLFAGAGFLYNVGYVTRIDSVEKDIYGDFKPQPWDIPVFVGMTFSFGEGIVRPLILVQGGLYVMTLAPDFEVGVGFSVECGGRGAFRMFLTARNVAWPHLSVNRFHGYPVTLAPSVKLGFSF